MTIDEMNTRYGAPGRIVFRKGHCGYPEVAIANKYGSAEIALLGANVLSYRPTGHSPVIFRPSRRDYNRGESIHGGIPVCWPQFGRLAIPGMSAHGFARIMPFSVRGTQYSEDMTEVTLALVSSPETRELWPHDFDLEVKVSVSMKLNLAMTTKNTGSEPFEFTGGFHPYFLVRERDAVSVRGLSGCDYVYAVDMTDHTLAGDLAMDKAADHVFKMPPVLKHEIGHWRLGGGGLAQVCLRGAGDWLAEGSGGACARRQADADGGDPVRGRAYSRGRIVIVERRRPAGA